MPIVDSHQASVPLSWLDFRSNYRANYCHCGAPGRVALRQADLYRLVGGLAALNLCYAARFFFLSRLLRQRTCRQAGDCRVFHSRRAAGGALD
jgi:hypothetical protein